jgi:hypothetical protein
MQTTKHPNNLSRVKMFIPKIDIFFQKRNKNISVLSLSPISLIFKNSSTYPTNEFFVNLFLAESEIAHILIMQFENDQFDRDSIISNDIIKIR